MLMERTGNDTAVITLLDSYGPRLFGYFRVMLREDEAATCALANTIITATEQMARLADGTRLTTWLWALARAECRHYRPAYRAQDDPVTAYDREHGEQSLALVARAALLRLGPDDRELLVLSACFRPAELAAVLGIDEREVVRRVRRARGRYQRVMSGKPGELAAMALAWAGERMPREVILACCTSPEYETAREHILNWSPALEPDGFPSAVVRDWPSGRSFDVPFGRSLSAPFDHSLGHSLGRRRGLVLLGIAIPMAFGAGFGSVTAFDHAISTPPQASTAAHIP
jgi:DNA-directed RNA polymerase specialized sigma24 family protein